MHSIVILGGNFAGISTAQYLLKRVLPLVNNESSHHKVTLVSPSAHTFFKVAVPRVLVSDKVSNHMPFASIPDAFLQYNSDEFIFIQGEAVRIDETAKTVSIKNVGTMNRLIGYDSLVIATGTTSASAVWTLHGNHDMTLSAFQDIQNRLPTSKTILIAGGGPVGVETAGEIASQHEDKEVILLSGGARLLPRLQNEKMATRAEQQLAALNVQTLHGIRVKCSTVAANKMSLVLSDGTTRSVDLYIDATGGIPNTGFLPPSWLDGSKHVIVNGTTLRATNAPEGVYAIGDVASYSKGGIPDAVWPVPALGYSIWSDLHVATIMDGSVKADAPQLKEAKYKQIQTDMSIVPIGPSGGVGALFGWAVPSWLVWLLKSRTFMVENAPNVATGY
ncbi:FAD/NAD(P)-binding domain-containing protein [Penicillium lagena]|uniref:FAD/NAD(P)-binding domain-containing protein n=1 Tax=Penicillium lagena TaxID=94218 RepID=UPI0025413243|nr:FAD/NAD(P)-binding domain-containing protein [Penicillium lagena]KAJ5621166.1 FAD/NAD(P)-binding domain-containing protein [Penicillium lagena]